MQLKEGDRVAVKRSAEHYSGQTGVVRRLVPYDMIEVLLDTDPNDGVPTLFALRTLEKADELSALEVLQEG